MKAVRILVSGRVQGVFFRKHTREKGLALALTGFVQNLPTGEVLIHAYGNAAQINEFISWCHLGPDQAIVEKVVVSDSAPVATTGFVIRY